MIHALEQVLAQGEGLLLALEDSAYQTSFKSAQGASIGGHYRHCLDHFEKLLEGIEDSSIDYDSRRRDRRLETDRNFAIARTKDLRLAVRKMDEQMFHHPIQIRCSVSQEEGVSPAVSSTIERELMFCISHSIHHFALIAMMCREMEVSLPEDFGVAPSTLKFRSAKET